MTEGTGTADFVISLSEAFAAPTTLDFATFGGSAVPEGLVPKARQVPFAVGQTEAIVSVRLKDDGRVEAGESFGVSVEGDGLAASGEARLLDDDGSIPILSVEGEAAREGDFMAFTVRLSQPAPSDVTVEYQTFDGTALGNVDYSETSGTLEFADGETTKTIRVYAARTRLSETDEALQVELFNAVGAGFGGRNQALRATGWALDDDAGGGQRARGSSPIVSEGKGTAEFTVTLSEAFSEETTLRFRHPRRVGAGRQRLRPDSGTLTFAAGQTEAVVSVDLKNDRKAEAAESFGLKVKGAGLAGAGEATILNDDGARRILSVEGETAQEGDFLTFAVRLSKASESEVTVDYQTVSGTALADTDFNATDGTLTFDARRDGEDGEGLRPQRLPVGTRRGLPLRALQPAKAPASPRATPRPMLSASFSTTTPASRSASSPSPTPGFPKRAATPTSSSASRVRSTTISSSATRPRTAPRRPGRTSSPTGAR